MGNPTEERAVFKAFLSKAPLFAGAPVKDWDLAPQEPPDVECDLSDGRKVDVELTSWVDEDQIAESKGRESLENPFRELFAEDPNNTENFWLVLLEVKGRLRKNDAQALRSEVLQLIAQLDQEHSTKPEWQLKDYFYFRDFENFPTMRIYLESLEMHPRAERGGDKGSIGWITFPMPGGFYSPESMVDALCERIQHKIDKYLVKPCATRDFHLLVHYDKAFAHNTPVIAPGFGFKEAVAAAAKRIGTAVGVFDQIFVYVDIKEGQAFRLYPQAEAASF